MGKVGGSAGGGRRHRAPKLEPPPSHWGSAPNPPPPKLHPPGLCTKLQRMGLENPNPNPNGHQKVPRGGSSSEVPPPRTPASGRGAEAGEEPRNQTKAKHFKHLCRTQSVPGRPPCSPGLGGGDTHGPLEQGGGLLPAAAFGGGGAGAALGFHQEQLRSSAASPPLGVLGGVRVPLFSPSL